MLHKKFLMVFCFAAHLNIPLLPPPHQIFLAFLRTPRFLSLMSCFFIYFYFLSPLPFVFLALTGYGNIAPSTEGGKIFCILYAIFGIPLFGFLLAGIGDQLGTIFVKSILRVEKIFRVSCKYHKYHNKLRSLCWCVVVLCSSSWRWQSEKLQCLKYYSKTSADNHTTTTTTTVRWWKCIYIEPLKHSKYFTK